VTRQDILIAEDISGPNLGSLKGMSTCTKQDHVLINKDDVLTEILEKLKDVILAAASKQTGGITITNKVGSS